MTTTPSIHSMLRMTVISSRAATKRPSYTTVAFPCAQCAVKIMVSPAEAVRAIEAHVNLWHPVVVGPSVKRAARNVTPLDSLGSGTGTAPS